MLCSRRKEVSESRAYPGHEKDTVNAHLPFLGQHNLCLFPEFTCAHVSFPCFLRLKELLRLWEEDSDDSDADGDSRCSRR